MQTPFISQQEMLLVASRYDTGTEWLGHPAESFDTAEEVARIYGNDEVVEFWRVDLVTKTVEDITEDVAKAYLALRENGEKTPEDEDLIPVFVACSEAWSEFCEGYVPPMSARVIRRQFGTHEVNGRVLA